MPKNSKGMIERAKEGDFSLVEPLDYLMLGLLPEKGETVMNFYPLAKTVPQLRKEKFEPLPPSQVMGVLRRLVQQNLALRVRMSGTTYGYQRTPLGKKVFEEWQTKNPDVSGAKGKGE